MTSDSITLLQAFLGGVWSIFDAVIYPGTILTVADVLLGFFFLSVFFGLLTHAFGFGASPDRSWNTPKPKKNVTISKSRRYDEK